MDKEIAKPHVHVCRRKRFSSAHRLHSKKFGDEENAKMFGACNRINGHGHNYHVEVTVRDPVDPHTGMVIDMSNLKQYLSRVIDDELNHRHLDKDVAFFEENISTMENISLYIWQRLKTIMPKSDMLYEVRVYETDDACAFYRGE